MDPWYKVDGHGRRREEGRGKIYVYHLKTARSDRASALAPFSSLNCVVGKYNAAALPLVSNYPSDAGHGCSHPLETGPTAQARPKARKALRLPSRIFPESCGSNPNREGLSLSLSVATLRCYGANADLRPAATCMPYEHDPLISAQKKQLGSVFRKDRSTGAFRFIPVHRPENSASKTDSVVLATVAPYRRVP